MKNIAYPASWLHFKKLIVVLLTIQLALPILSTDIYLPSLTTITQYFDTTINQVQLTLSAYFFIFGFSQLIYGPLSDQFGRKPIMLVGLFVYIVSTLCCAFSINIEMFIISRCLQACGAGSAILVFAMIRDLYQGEQVSKMITYMSAVVAISPIIAPILGGYIEVHASWQWNFIILTSAGLALLILSYQFLPETNHYQNQSKLFKSIFVNYFNLLSNRNFMGYTLSAAFAFAALFSYVSGAPYVMLNLMHYSPSTFGWLFASAAIGYVTGAYVNGRIVSRVGLEWMSYLGTRLLVLSSIILVIGNFFYPNYIALLLLPQIVQEFGISIVVATNVAQALQPIPHCVGAGSALIGCLRFLLAALCSYIVVAFQARSSLQLTVTIFGCSVLSWISLYLRNLPKKMELRAELASKGTAHYQLPDNNE